MVIFFESENRSVDRQIVPIFPEANTSRTPLIYTNHADVDNLYRLQFKMTINSES